MMISGGKDARAPAPWPSLKAGQAFLEETFAPLRYNLTGHVKASADLPIGKTIGGKEHNLGSHDITIR
jgi:hypothetical protein